jgi:hypothetical protein
MAHYDLMLLEQSDLRAAIRHIRSAPLAFLMEVAQDLGYSPRLRLEGCNFIL